MAYLRHKVVRMVRREELMELQRQPLDRALLDELMDMLDGHGDWTSLGFQQQTPETDFRSIGQLGLYSIHFFALRYPIYAQYICQKACRFPLQYPGYAITGIHFAYGSVRYSFSILTPIDLFMRYPTIGLEDYLALFSTYWISFDRAWDLEKPIDIMSFKSIREKVFNQIERKCPFH